MAVTQALRRVEALEAATGGGGECPECGGTDDFEPDDTYEIRWIDPGEADPVETWCETCGRQTTIVITWDGLPTGSV
jgi:hypothetical protein